jgi:terminal uridylyltransferase
VQEYLRRAAQLGTDITLPLDAEKGDEVEAEGSVISEATLDELARLSELEDDELHWRAEEEGAQARRKHQHKVAAAAATAAATSGIARKDRENSAAGRR